MKVKHFSLLPTAAKIDITQFPYKDKWVAKSSQPHTWPFFTYTKNAGTHLLLASQEGFRSMQLVS
jgi:hypothetical protein